MIKCNNCENHFSNQSNIIETCLEFRACRALEGNRVASCKVDLASTRLFVDKSFTALAFDHLGFQQSAIFESFSTFETGFPLQIVLLLGLPIVLGSLHACTQSSFPSIKWRRIIETSLTKAKVLQLNQSIPLATATRHAIHKRRFVNLFLHTLRYHGVGALSGLLWRQLCLPGPSQLLQQVLMQEAHFLQVTPRPTLHLT